jgi:hypothetical protein
MGDDNLLPFISSLAVRKNVSLLSSSNIHSVLLEFGKYGHNSLNS